MFYLFRQVLAYLVLARHDFLSYIYSSVQYVDYVYVQYVHIH